MSLVSDLHAIFVDRNYQWNMNGTLAVPTEEDISLALDKIKIVLENEPVDTSLEVGRLRVQKTDVGLELYVYLGDLP